MVLVGFYRTLLCRAQYATAIGFAIPKGRYSEEFNPNHKLKSKPDSNSG